MLSVPPFVLAAALLLWGATAGFLPAAVALALVVDGSRFSALRFDLGHRDFERIADSCSVLLAGALVYALLGASNFSESLVAVLRWLPLLFAPLIVAQRLSTAGTVPLSALFWSLRRGRARGSAATATVPASGVHAADAAAGSIDFAYLGACLLAAAAANVRALWFYLALGALVLIALWPQRRPAGGRAAWPALAAAALALGFGIQAALSSMQSALEDAALQWLESRWQAHADPYRARTAIGDIGTLKFSDRILLRIDAAAHDTVPLLRHAAYTRYVAGAWSAPALPFRPLAWDARGWVLAHGDGGTRLGVSGWAAEGRALLALPASTVRVNGLAASSVQANGIGAVRVEDAPQPLVYEAWYAPGAGGDTAPGAEDLIVPAALAAPLREIVSSLRLRATAPAEVLDGVQGFFASGFEYSLDLDAPDGGARSLMRFLTKDRRGHCEYFATATVLLLRTAGIPARYATGYAVQEWSEIEKRYLVRARHAHAWALAWVGGKWQEVDTTPAVWAQQDAQRASRWQWLYDIGSALNYRFVMWRTQQRDGSLAWAWLIAPLAGWLLWRVWRRRARSAPKGRGRAPPTHAPLAALLHVLARLGYQRPIGAPLHTWSRALPLADRGLRALLDEAMRDYYRLRFDPAADRSTTAAALEVKLAALTARLNTIRVNRGSER